MSSPTNSNHGEGHPQRRDPSPAASNPYANPVTSTNPLSGSNPVVPPRIVRDTADGSLHDTDFVNDGPVASAHRYVQETGSMPRLPQPGPVLVENAPAPRPPLKDNNPFTLASFILGFVSIPMILVPLLNLIVPAIGFTLGLYGLLTARNYRTPNKGMGITGMVLSLLCLVAGIFLMMSIVVYFGANTPSTGPVPATPSPLP